ncbi:MAG: AMP-binding protein, partial [Ottowia sp.]|uniref:AMP-binding protein n=1 Tax=Ottowia sp. TaxID=1898956 RepID=UPI003C71FC3D
PSSSPQGEKGPFKTPEPHDAQSLAQTLAHAATRETGLRLFNGQGELAAQISYRDLHQHALTRARQLQAWASRHSWQRHTAIGLLADTSLSFITNFFACQYAGLVPCPVPPPQVGLGLQNYVQRMDGMLCNVQARALLIDEGHAPLQAHFERQGAVVPLVQTASLPPGEPPHSALLTPLQDTEPAYIQFSSGTTNAPKGIQISQRAICRNMHGILHTGLRITSSDRAFSWLPLYHDMGLVGFLLSPIAGAVPLDLLPPQAFARRPQLWPRLMSDLRSTVCFAPGFAWRLAAERTPEDEARHLSLSALRIAGVGGDFIRAGDLNGFTQRFAASGFTEESFHPCYGMAEATLAVSMGPARADDTGMLTSGKPLPGWEVRIVNEAGAPLPARQTGLVHLRGSSLMTGYWQNGQLLPAASDDWFHTKDVGYLTVDGDLVVTGRQQSLLVIRGRNVHAEAVESAVSEALRLSHGAVMAYQEASSSMVDPADLVVLVECPAQDPKERTHWAETARQAAFAASGAAADVRLVAPRTVKLTSSGKIARQWTLKALIGHD